MKASPDTSCAAAQPRGFVPFSALSVANKATWTALYRPSTTARTHQKAISLDEAFSLLKHGIAICAVPPSAMTPSADIASRATLSSSVKEEESGVEQHVFADGFGPRLSAHGSYSATSLPGYSAALLKSNANFTANKLCRHWSRTRLRSVSASRRRNRMPLQSYLRVQRP